MGFGNVGIGEMMVILVIVMVVFGPNRLPEMARSMGKFLRNFQRETSRALSDLKQGIEIEPVKLGVFDEPDAKPSSAGVRAPVTTAPSAATTAPLPKAVLAATPPVTTRKPASTRKAVAASKPAATRKTGTKGAAPKRSPAPAATKKKASPARTGSATRSRKSR